MPYPKQKSVGLPGEIHQEVKDIAQKHGLPIKDLIIEAARLYDRVNANGRKAQP